MREGASPPPLFFCKQFHLRFDLIPFASVNFTWMLPLVRRAGFYLGDLSGWAKSESARDLVAGIWA
jgi:hypothetical protein